MFNAAIGSHDHYRATQTYTINLKTSMRQFKTQRYNNYLKQVNKTFNTDVTKRSKAKKTKKISIY